MSAKEARRRRALLYVRSAGEAWPEEVAAAATIRPEHLNKAAAEVADMEESEQFVRTPEGKLRLSTDVVEQVGLLSLIEFQKRKEEEERFDDE